MKRWRQWLRECPLWYKPEYEYGGVTVMVTPKKFDMTISNSFPGINITDYEHYNNIEGHLSAEWDTFDPKVHQTSKFRIIVVLPDEGAAI